MGQIGFGQLFQKQNLKFKIQRLFPFGIQTKFKNSNNINKTFSYSLMK
jgi:hypothetical protein